MAHALDVAVDAAYDATIVDATHAAALAATVADAFDAMFVATNDAVPEWVALDAELAAHTLQRGHAQW